MGVEYGCARVPAMSDNMRLAVILVSVVAIVGIAAALAMSAGSQSGSSSGSSPSASSHPTATPTPWRQGEGGEYSVLTPLPTPTPTPRATHTPTPKPLLASGSSGSSRRPTATPTGRCAFGREVPTKAVDDAIRARLIHPDSYLRRAPILRYDARPVDDGVVWTTEFSAWNQAGERRDGEASGYWTARCAVVVQYVQ